MEVARYVLRQCKRIMIKRRGKRPLAVGVQLPEVERVVRWPELKAMAVRADQLGYDSLWVGDHLIYRQTDAAPTGPWEAWSSLAAIAAVTDSVRLGPLVAATGFHNPAMLAKKAAAVDEISGGRLVLGLGAGWNETEYRAFGFPFEHRVSRFEEAFTIIRRLLAGEKVDFSGTYYSTDACEILPRSCNPDGPPLLDRLNWSTSAGYHPPLRAAMGMRGMPGLGIPPRVLSPTSTSSTPRVRRRGETQRRSSAL